MTLRTDRGPRALRIAGVYYDYSSDRGWVAMSRRTYERYWQGGGYSSIGVYARPGIGDARLRAAVQARLPEGLGVGITQSRTIRAESMKLFDRTFAITRVLRLLAAVIAFAGVFSALMALELERTRELGLLRALGMTQAGLFGLLLVETGLTGLIAGLLSVPVRRSGRSCSATDARGARGRGGRDRHAVHLVSPRGGHRYPARTRLRVPNADLELEVTPRLPWS